MYKYILAKRTYPHDSPCYTFVINNEEFRDEHGNLIKEMTRHGTKHDADKIHNVFGKCNSIVIEEKNVNSKVCNILRSRYRVFSLTMKRSACIESCGLCE